jgi:anti-sigma regulatory factor (Ser/Thr protein kinase)
LEHASDGPSALAIARAGNVDVLLLGCDLASNEATEILRLSKQMVLPTSVISLVQGGDLAAALSALHEGAADVLQKPLCVDSTEASLLRTLNVARMRGGNRSAQQALQTASMTHQFRTDELAAMRFGLELADRLVLGGWLDLNGRTRFELAFQEALANAIEHGNLELDSRWREEIDASGQDRYSSIKRERLTQENYAGRVISIRLTFDAAAAIFEVQIKDQGPGFVIERLGQDTAKRVAVQGVAVHGRGLKLMKECVDSVEYTDAGRTITLSKMLRRTHKSE